MSEYWKSTPKYWCKFCKTYVRDSTIERKNHDATPKHQHSIQRSLRELHKTSERDEREKQRAKDEVARLNGLVAGKSGASSASASASGPSAPRLQSTAAPAPSGPASAAERKRQMEQLAAMGVAVPEEYRRDMSIASEWATVSETPIYSTSVKPENGPDHDEDSKAFGVRKRKIDDEEDELDKGPARNAWGSRFKSYPGAKANSEEDLDALLTGATAKKDVKKEEQDALKKEDDPEATDTIAAIPDVAEPVTEPRQEQDAPPVVFKKRKGKR